MIELQDNVLARTRYLSLNSVEAEMPRFVKLKLLRLYQRQVLTLAESKTAIDEAIQQKNQPASIASKTSKCFPYCDRKAAGAGDSAFRGGVGSSSPSSIDGVGEESLLSEHELSIWGKPKAQPY